MRTGRSAGGPELRQETAGSREIGGSSGLRTISAEALRLELEANTRAQRSRTAADLELVGALLAIGQQRRAVEALEEYRVVFSAYAEEIGRLIADADPTGRPAQ